MMIVLGADTHKRSHTIAAAVLLVGLHADLQVLHRDRPAPPPGPVANTAFHSTGSHAQAVTVWAVGDGAADTTFARDLAVMIAAPPARPLYPGDVYESGTNKQFRDRHPRNLRSPRTADATDPPATTSGPLT